MVISKGTGKDFEEIQQLSTLTKGLETDGYGTIQSPQKKKYKWL